ncbi:hypothetical protein L7F22_035608 [Adiantum nelumboides]|nr:hypothetical protein [Adiantum nelumboides]
MVENEIGYKVQTLRTDRGGEYMSGAFKDFLGKKGIKHQCTMPYTPQQNGVAERKNMSLMEMARCMLKAKSLPHKLWMEAVACATHVLNRCPTRALKTITPYEAWYDRKPSVNYLCIFGCLAYAHISQQLRGKLDDKAVKCIFVGRRDAGQDTDLRRGESEQSQRVAFNPAGTAMSTEEDTDASREILKDNQHQEEDQDVQPTMTTTSRGFSGAPKFSDFRRTVTSTNTSTTTAPNQASDMKEGNKDNKPVTKARGIDDDLGIDYPNSRETDTSAVDEEIEDGHGLVEKISEQISSVKQEIKHLTHDFVHEVKEFYDKAIKGDHDP